MGAKGHRVNGIPIPTHRWFSETRGTEIFPVYTSTLDPRSATDGIASGFSNPAVLLRCFPELLSELAMKMRNVLKATGEAYLQHRERTITQEGCCRPQSGLVERLNITVSKKFPHDMTCSAHTEPKKAGQLGKRCFVRMMKVQKILNRQTSIYICQSPHRSASIGGKRSHHQVAMPLQQTSAKLPQGFENWHRFILRKRRQTICGGNGEMVSSDVLYQLRERTGGSRWTSKQNPLQPAFDKRRHDPLEKASVALMPPPFRCFGQLFTQTSDFKINAGPSIRSFNHQTAGCAMCKPLGSQIRNQRSSQIMDGEAKASKALKA